MPQYETLPSLAGQPFTLVLARFPKIEAEGPVPGADGGALADFIQGFPIQPGIGEVITNLDKDRFSSIPGLPVYEVPFQGGAGDWLSRALEMASFPRTLILGAGTDNELPGEKDLLGLAEKLEMAHLVLLPRPQRAGNPVVGKLREFWMTLRKWVFALDPRPNPKWPGLGYWWRRILARWVLGVPGEDPETPVRMVRSGLTQGMRLQAQREFVWVEMLAKSTFLSALIEELPVRDSNENSWGGQMGRPAPKGWGRDFRLVFSNPEFGKPWSPNPGEPKSQILNPQA